MPTLIHLVLKYIQVVCGGYSDDVLLGVPGRVQNLLVEVQAVHADLVLLPLAAGADLARLQHRTRLVVLPGRLQGDISLGVPVEHPEEVVVGPCHDDAAGRGRKEGKNTSAKNNLSFFWELRLSLKPSALPTPSAVSGETPALECVIF